MFRQLWANAPNRTLTQQKAAPRGGLVSFVSDLESYGVTRNSTLLLSMPLSVVTLTVPVVAPVGTEVLISELEFEIMVAVVPLKVTLVAPVRLVPRILTSAPTLPEVGWVSTKGFKPVDRLKMVPQPPVQAVLVPPSSVEP
jgi:hypothetical protein